MGRASSMGLMDVPLHGRKHDEQGKMLRLGTRPFYLLVSPPPGLCCLQTEFQLIPQLERWADQLPRLECLPISPQWGHVGNENTS